MRRVWLAAASTWGLLGSQAAWAEEAAPVGADDGREVIIVTGEKSERSLQDTTASVAVTTPEKIEEENLLSIQDVFQRTANVTETYGSSGFTIRGINNRGTLGGEGAALATIFVDGAALPSSVTQAAPADMFDVQQVEILRGPQSTLQGLNALAGAVIVTTTEPTMNWTAHARAMIAERDETQFAAAGGGPIVEDQLAFRVSIEKRDSDGYTWNPTRNAPENPLDSTLIRGKILLKPADLPGLEARVNVTHYKRYGGYAFSYTDTTVPNFFDNRINMSNLPNDSDARTNLGTVDLGYDFGGGFRLTALSTYNTVREFNRYDNDLTAADGGQFTQANDYKTFSQELRLNYDSDRLSGLVGLFYYDRKAAIASTSDVGVPTPLGAIQGLLLQNGADAQTAALIASLYGQALPVIPVNYAAASQGRVKTYAVFGDVRYKLTDRLSLLAGFRYDHEKNNIAVNQVTRFAGTFPDPANYGPQFGPIIALINQGVAGIVAQASGSAQAIDRTFNAFLPKGGIEMAWTDDVKTAFTVQRGYRSGGSSSNIARSQTFAYDPEFTWNYELSLRSAWLNGTLTLNANAFYIDWKDQQVSANFGLGVYDTNIVNAGKSHLYGFEVEATHRVSPVFDWYASIGYTRTQFDEFKTTVGAVTDYEGLEFQHAPHWTLSGGVNLRPFDGLSLNVNASHRTRVFSEISIPQSDTRLGPRTLVNARVAYDIGKHLTVSAFARNLFDEHYFQYTTVDLGRGVIGDPRVFGAAVEAKF